LSRYNLIDEKWIPVRLLDGTRDELGIRATLLKAKEIAVIEDGSPLVVAALHRFLLALMYRSLEGPTDIDQARIFFDTGFPFDKIEAYLEKWRDRFWLFDERYPFGQNTHVPRKEIEPWTKLTAEFNATSNKVLFDHTNTKRPGEREPKECARWLLATMNFSISGGRGYFPSPSPNAMICIPLGRNLHETLCYCLVPQNREVMCNDQSIWERDPKFLPIKGPKRVSSGYADLFTWQSRMVLLEAESGNVAFMRFIAGEGFDNPSGNPDPMQPYKSDNTRGILPVQFREDRAPWRDFDSLLPDEDERYAPLTMHNALRVAANKAERMPESVLVLGLKYKPPNANLEFWRMERFRLPGALVGDRNIRSHIREFLDAAENAQQSLRLACRCYARNLLCRGNRLPDPKDVGGFVSQMPCIPWYWSVLEAKFHEIVQAYTMEKNPEEIELVWLQSVSDALRDSWDQHRASVSMGDPWTIRGLVKAEEPIRRKHKELGEVIADLKKSLGKEDA